MLREHTRTDETSGASVCRGTEEEAAVAFIERVFETGLVASSPLQKDRKREIERERGSEIKTESENAIYLALWTLSFCRGLSVLSFSRGLFFGHRATSFSLTALNNISRRFFLSTGLSEDADDEKRKNNNNKNKNYKSFEGKQQ